MQSSLVGRVWTWVAAVSILTACSSDSSSDVASTSQGGAASGAGGAGASGAGGNAGLGGSAGLGGKAGNSGTGGAGNAGTSGAGNAGTSGAGNGGTSGAANGGAGNGGTSAAGNGGNVAAGTGGGSPAGNGGTGGAGAGGTGGTGPLCAATGFLPKGTAGSGGTAGMTSSCVVDCPRPACATDGNIYPDVCSLPGGLTECHSNPPSLPGYFFCDGVYCREGQDLCVRASGQLQRSACLQIPTACLANATCSCYVPADFLCTEMIPCTDCSASNGDITLSTTVP